MTTEARPRSGWNPWRIAGWGLAASLLALPAIGMRFTSEIVWDESDFIAMGVLIGVVGLGIEFLVRQSNSIAYRLGSVATLATAFLTIWVNLAVGMIGPEDNRYNLLFGGVIGIALLGALAARFRARGMAKAMVAAAAAQAAAGIGGVASDMRGGVLSAGFAILWLVAATLFRLADGGRSAAQAARSR